MITAGENWLETEIPALAFPVIKQMDEGVISIITDAIYNYFVQIIDVTAIRLVNSLAQSAWENASLQLNIVAAESGLSSPQYQQAKATALADMSKFTDIARGQS